MPRDPRRAVCVHLLLLLVGAASLSTASGGVHHPVSSSRWHRTRCGASGSKGADIITAHGRAISPDTVKEAFGYPRPQMRRPGWHSLNGLWQFTAAPGRCRFGPVNCDGARPPFGEALPETVLVPFPVESCLSGLENASLPGSPPTHQRMVYRTLIDGGALLREAAALAQQPGDPPAVLLHFGAVDWQAEVYVNGLWVGSHEGGYDGFAFDIADALGAGSASLDEVIVVAHDPSNYGAQPFGKQRTSAMWRPAGDTYSPNSGIWQTVWVEPVPAAGRIDSVKLAPNTSHLNLNVLTTPGGCDTVSVTVHTDSVPVVAAGPGRPNLPFSIPIPTPKLWSPEQPFLYNMTVRCGADAVESYFGMREVTVGRDPTANANRPCINAEYRFLAGVLDQSFWPDGIYTAPGDAALASDLEAMKGFGFNYVRLHQKVNPERWYYHADRLGVVVMQDVVQHYGDSVQGAGSEYQSNNGGAKARHYFHDLKALIDGRGSHPAIVQWDLFNEQDMVEDFNTSGVLRWVRAHDPTRLIDVDSGGPANSDHRGDVDDLHVGAPVRARRGG